MQIEVTPFGLVMPEAARAMMPNTCAILFREVGGTRRCLIGFPKQYWPYIVTAMYEVVHRDNKAALHGSVVRLLLHAGLAIERLVIRKEDDAYTGTLSITQNGIARDESMPLADAVPMAFHARCAIVMDANDLNNAEELFSAVADRFLIVEKIGDIPLHQAEWRAKHEPPTTLN